MWTIEGKDSSGAAIDIGSCYTARECLLANNLYINGNGRGFSRMKREFVYKLIDGERDYQDSKWGSVEENPKLVGAW